MLPRLIFSAEADGSAKLPCSSGGGAPSETIVSAEAEESTERANSADFSVSASNGHYTVLKKDSR